MESASRRPGPRNDVNVKEALLDAAEALFGDASVDAVSLRAVAREAGVGPTALHHHFASKGALLRAVVGRRTTPMGRQLWERLTAVRDAPSRPSSRDVIDAVLLPFVDVLDADPVGGLRWVKLFTSLALTEDPVWVDELNKDPSITELFLHAAGRAIPDVTDREVQRRAGIVMFAMMTALASTGLDGYGRPLGPDGLDTRYVEQLAIFLAAGFEGGGG